MWHRIGLLSHLVLPDTAMQNLGIFLSTLQYLLRRQKHGHKTTQKCTCIMLLLRTGSITSHWGRSNSLKKWSSKWTSKCTGIDRILGLPRRDPLDQNGRWLRFGRAQNLRRRTWWGCGGGWGRGDDFWGRSEAYSISTTWPFWHFCTLDLGTSRQGWLTLLLCCDRRLLWYIYRII